MCDPKPRKTPILTEEQKKDNNEYLKRWRAANVEKTRAHNTKNLKTFYEKQENRQKRNKYMKERLDKMKEEAAMYRQIKNSIDQATEKRLLAV